MKALRQRINQRTTARRHALLSHRSAGERDALALWDEQAAHNTATKASLRDQIIDLHDEHGLSFAAIGSALGMSRAWANKVYLHGGDQNGRAA